ncbi:Wzz/FepE/Etk N-terminal domain-containing protein [Pseudomonas trivialis]|uniref:Wzz/FepE/Etk N-terminal domain-containing protein n=1 Tax=Pseudomonas trivialis TaxID=200450 RepID=UPI0030CD4205
MSSSFRVPPSQATHEFNVVDIVSALCNQKKLIAATIMIGASVGFGYGMLVTPEYRVSSVLRPAALNELDALNRTEVYVLPPREALKRLGSSLESYETRLEFFRSHQNLFEPFVKPGRTLEQSFEEFNLNSVSVTSPELDKADSLNDYIKLEMNYPANMDGVSILNGLVDFAIQKERRQIGADINVIVNNRLSELQEKFAASRASYQSEKEVKVASLAESDNLKQAQLSDELRALRVQLKAERSNRVAQLNEAISIALKLGIKKPSSPSSLTEPVSNGSANVMRTEINNQQIPLYFMGVDALEAERRALLTRKSDDFVSSRISQIAKEQQLLKSNREIEVLAGRENEDVFLSGVQPLRAEISRLRNINTDMSQLKLVTVDKKALEPLSPIRPQKALNIILGAMMGGLLGIIIALALKRNRTRK